MELVPLAPRLRSELHVPKDVSGVVVGRIAPDSPARALGIGHPIRRRDRIDRSETGDDTEQAADESKEAAAHGYVLLLLNRHGASAFVGFSVENNGIAGSSR